MNGEYGFTYLGVLLMIAVIGIGLAAASEVWVTSARRQKMVELEWIGDQFKQAIGSYYEASPGSVKMYPASLQALIEDRRYLTMRRHLRRIYVNPFTGKVDWELITGVDGQVHGVRASVPLEPRSMSKEFVYDPAVR